MKKKIIFILMIFLVSLAFAQNIVDYTKNWESRNALIYENDNELWDICVNKYSITEGCVYSVKYFVEKKEYSDTKSNFEGWFVHDEYTLYFDDLEKVTDFMDALTQAYLMDKSILETNHFIDFVEKKFNYKFTDKKYKDFEIRDKNYRITLISEDEYSVAINVYKTFYGTSEDTEYAFVYRDDTENITYWIEDFDAEAFLLNLVSFYNDFETDLNLKDYFATLSGEFIDAEGMNGIMLVDDFDMKSLYKAFKNDFWYSIFTSIADAIEEKETANHENF